MSGKPERERLAQRRTALTDDEATRLWREFLTGDNPRGDQAFDELYRALRTRLVRFCSVRLRNIHDGEDAADQVFARLLESRPPVKSSFIGLLFRTARNVCASASAPHRQLPPDPLRHSDDPAAAMEQIEQRAAVADCISRLTDRDQELVILRYGEDLTYRQIRDVLGLRVVLSSISRWLKAAKAQLRRCLKEKNIFHAKIGR